MIKNLINKLFSQKWFASIQVKLRLNLMQWCYKDLGYYAGVLEGGVHPKKRIMRYHDFFVSNITENDTVLDIGCGNGYLALSLSEAASKVTAVDKNPICIKNAHRILKDSGSSNIQVIEADATTYKFEHEFNVIVLSNVLEHIDHRVNFLTKIKDLAPKILLRVPMINRDWLTLYRKERGLEYRLDRTHTIEYTMKELQEEISQGGWVIRSYSIQFGEFWGVLNRS